MFSNFGAGIEDWRKHFVTNPIKKRAFPDGVVENFVRIQINGSIDAIFERRLMIVLINRKTEWSVMKTVHS